MTMKHWNFLQFFRSRVPRNLLFIAVFFRGTDSIFITLPPLSITLPHPPQIQRKFLFVIFFFHFFRQQFFAIFAIFVSCARSLLLRSFGREQGKLCPVLSSPSLFWLTWSSCIDLRSLLLKEVKSDPWCVLGGIRCRCLRCGTWWVSGALLLLFALFRSWYCFFPSPRWSKEQHLTRHILVVVSGFPLYSYSIWFYCPLLL